MWRVARELERSREALDRRVRVIRRDEGVTARGPDLRIIRRQREQLDEVGLGLWLLLDRREIGELAQGAARELRSGERAERGGVGGTCAIDVAGAAPEPRDQPPALRR